MFFNNQLIQGVLLFGLLQQSAVAETIATHPVRRAGLWELQSTAAKANGLEPVRQCVGGGTDTANNHLDRATGQRGFCQLRPFVRLEESWVAESVCRHSRNNVVTQKIATGDFRTEYQIETVVRSGRDKKTRVLVTDMLSATYIGPCQDGLRTEDLISPGMGTLNMLDGSFQAEKRKSP